MPDTTMRSAPCGIPRRWNGRRTALECRPSTLPSTVANNRTEGRHRAYREERSMKESEVMARAFAMPLTNPAYPPGPYRFVDREFMVITYRTDPDKLRAVVPEPLEVDEPLVKYEFIRMPDSTGFGDYTETGQVIPVRFRGRKGGYSHCMFLNDEPPIAGGRELWGFPKNSPTRRCTSRSINWSARSTTARCGSSPPRWDTSTRRPMPRRSAPRWERRIFC